jgi:hypothetical protein
MKARAASRERSNVRSRGLSGAGAVAGTVQAGLELVGTARCLGPRGSAPDRGTA